MFKKLNRWIKADDDKPLWYVRPYIVGTIIGTIFGSALGIWANLTFG